MNEKPNLCARFRGIILSFLVGFSVGTLILVTGGVVYFLWVDIHAGKLPPAAKIGDWSNDCGFYKDGVPIDSPCAGTLRGGNDGR